MRCEEDNAISGKNINDSDVRFTGAQEQQETQEVSMVGDLAITIQRLERNTL